MRRLVDSVEIDASPEAVWAWLEALADHYTAWHPGHVSAHWRLGEPNELGSVLEVVEDIGDHRERLRFEVTRSRPPRLMEYRIQGAHSLLLPGGAFEVCPLDGGTRFIASVWCRGGVVVERLFRRRIAALRKHMREEGQNLKRLLTSRERTDQEIE